MLSLLIFLPLLGALVTGLASSPLAKKIALAVAGLELLLTLWVWQLFIPQNGAFQLLLQSKFMPMLGIDGISVLLLPITALLTLTAMLTSWTQQRWHFAALLALTGTTMLVLTALNLLVFFISWELTLALLFVLISVQQRGAAIKYTLFMMVGSVPLLIAFILLANNYADSISGNLSFSFLELIKMPLPDTLQGTVFFLLLLGFAIKAPLVPFHTWLTSVVTSNAAHSAVLLIGVNLGIYGLLRFAMPLAPLAAVQYSWVLGIFGAVTLMYGALCALQQNSLHRLIAYNYLSQVGLVIIGLSSLNQQGWQGALLQLLNFALVTSSLILLADVIQQRVGDTDVQQTTGLAKAMPRLSCFYFLFILASLGMPLTSGFPAQLLIVIGALTSHPTLGITALAGMLLATSCVFSFTRRTFFGATNNTELQDLRRRDILLLCVPALLVLLLGFAPNTVLKTTEKTAQAWLDQLMVQTSNVGKQDSLYGNSKK